jgi:hypothetical protein
LGSFIRRTTPHGSAGSPGLGSFVRQRIHAWGAVFKVGFVFSSRKSGFLFLREPQFGFVFSTGSFSSQGL